MSDQPNRYHMHPFWRPLWLHRGAYRDIAVASVFLNLLAVALPVFTRVVYDRVIPNFAEATLWVLLSGMALVVVFELCFKLSRSFISDHLGYQAGSRLEQEFMEHALRLPHGPGLAKMGQYFSHLNEIRDFFCHKLVPTMVDAPFVLMFLLAMYLISPPMVIVTAVVGGLLIGVQYAFHSVLHRELGEYQRVQLARQQALVETLGGRDTLRQLAAYAPFEAQWRERTGESATRSADASFWQSMVAYLSAILVLLNSVLMMVVGVYEIHAGDLSVGSLLAVNLLSTRALAPMASIGTIAAKWPHIYTQMQTLENVLAQPAEREDAEPFTLRGALQLQQVTVQYPGQPLPVLKDVSLALPRGKKLALVGASGAGKSTLLRLLAAEIPAVTGAVRWDEREIGHINPVQLRGQLGIVEQYPYFFARSLRENLTLGIEREEEDIRQALEMVGMDMYVRQTGQGLDYLLTDGGSNLSGGQRQCLAIARALLRRAPVLLMDEPTSMMDHATEARVVQNLHAACANVTLVLVTHRTPLLALVDSVAVLEGGRLTRMGARDAVLKELTQHAGA